MHEASLIKDLVRRIEQIAADEQAAKVVSVGVWLGALSHMSADHFREHFSHATAGTCAQGANLEIELSDDVSDPHAQDLLLRRVDIDS